MAGWKNATVRSRAVLASLFALILLGCNDQTPTVETPPRPIKSFTVGESVGGMVRHFSGVSEAAESAALSFSVGGTVREILVGVGDRVAEGEVIARLDPEPFELDVQAARADVEKAQADVVAKKGDLERNQALYEKDWVALAAVEKNQAAYDSAESSLNYARSRLSLAERNLANAMLVAPYEGTIASRPAERFEEVNAGQTIVEMNSTAGLLVAFSVPETGISRISLGEPVSVRFSAENTTQVEGRITEINTVATTGNAYTVKASLQDPPSTLRPGMTAEISISDPVDAPDAGYLVPLSAIAPGDSEFVGTVFRYDRDAGVVHRTPIKANGVRDNFVIVQEGVAPGDIIASAGVAFLMDGQAVRLLTE